MKNRFAELAVKGALLTERPGRAASQIRLVPLLGLGLVVTMLVAPLLTASEARAQAAGPAESEPESERRASSGIEEIVVHGAESDASQDFAAGDSVTGFGAEDLAALGAQSIADIAAFTPNLEIVTYGSTSPTFFIRGVGLNDFNSNSTGAVAVYQDDVPRNAPALQLSTLFDVEAVNVLRGPQGTGLARNASAGAIKIYSRKPTGEFGGFLRSDLGNFGFRDFEGAVEAPIFEDILAARFAFRYTERDGTMKNRCGNAIPFSDRAEVPTNGELAVLGLKNTDAPWSLCGEPVERIGGRPFVSEIPEGLPNRVNNQNNWAARGTLLFQPTLDMTWLVNAHGSKRDEWSRLGQSIGTRGFFCDEGDTTLCGLTEPQGGIPVVQGWLGGAQGNAARGYQAPEILDRLIELSPCNEGIPGRPGGDCNDEPETRASDNAAKIELANELARNLDSKPLVGDFNMCGVQLEDGRPGKPGTIDPTSPFRDRNIDGTRCKKDKGKTKNDTWGAFLNGDIVLPFGMQLTTITGYDTYDRLIDIDLDFSPETLFQIRTDDDGWQATQDLRLQGQLGDDAAVRWDIGGWFLREQLNVNVQNDLGRFSFFAPGERDYTQDLWSAAGFASVSIDFWEDFTLDMGFRYNWERKKIDYELTQANTLFTDDLDEEWTAPTGTIRLTYRFREDTHVFWKYSHGWKPGTYNATSSLEGVTATKPEKIDAFEAGVRGSWFDGRLGLDFSLFYYKYQDYQLFTAQQFAGGQPEFVILNADDAEVYGAEVDAVGRPWDGAFVNLRFGWLQSQFLDFVQIQQDIIVVQGQQVIVNRELQNTGNQLLNSPQFKVSITAEQTFPMGRWGSLTGRYDGVWTDETFFDATEGRGIPNDQGEQFLPEHTTSQPDFWLHNFRLSYRPRNGSFEIAGWVRNIADDSYKTFAFDANTFNETSVYFVGDPRTYGGTLTVNF
jgi:outer membrane receptor protein involved in Fe transport